MAVRRGAGEGGTYRIVLRGQRGFQGEGVLPLGKGWGDYIHLILLAGSSVARLF